MIRRHGLRMPPVSVLLDSPTRATTRGRKGRGEDAATWDNAAAIFSGRPPAMRWTPDVVDASPSEHGSSVLTFPRP